MSHSMKVLINPRSNVFYGSFYLHGLIERFGTESIEFNSIDFPNFELHHSLAFILKPSGQKIFIDAKDSSKINKQALLWCDVYAKVNSDSENLITADPNKILPIGPSFGIQIWNSGQLLQKGIYNYWMSRNEITKSKHIREYFADYWRQYRQRLPLSEYSFKPATGNYIFHLSSIWKKEPICNIHRANFIDACRSLSFINFEGGFAPRVSNDVEGFERLTLDRRYSISKYINKLRQSIVAFNTPAVDQCHGWKLGEFLALGKAIISTPLSRSLPIPLENGKHIHIVDGSIEESRKAVELLWRDVEYRKRLENNAYEYYLEHLKPNKIIEKILRFSSF